MYLDLWLGDVRFAWRAVARRPAFTALVVLTLALGIGVNSAVFALVDAVLLRPLPYIDPSRLAFVWQTLPEHNVFEVEATPFDYDAWHQVRSFAQIGLVDNDAFTLTGNDNPELFAEGPAADWALPVPSPVDGATAGQQRFVFELDGLPPNAKPDGATLMLTAVSDGQAIEVPYRLD